MLLGWLGIKAAEALPCIIGGIISWILNRAKDAVGWVSQNLWALVVGVGGLIYTYVVTRNNYITILQYNLAFEVIQKSFNSNDT